MSRHLRMIRFAVMLAAGLPIAACSSTSPPGTTLTGAPSRPTTSASDAPASPPTSTVPLSPTTSTPPGSSATSAVPVSPPAGGGRTMSPPHIVCSQSSVTKQYDGAQPNPVELCAAVRTTVRIVITPPAGQTWALPTAGPQDMLVSHASRSGNEVIIAVRGIRRGTVTVSVPRTSWRLQIAMI